MQARHATKPTSSLGNFLATFHRQVNNCMRALALPGHFDALNADLAVFENKARRVAPAACLRCTRCFEEFEHAAREEARGCSARSRSSAALTFRSGCALVAVPRQAGCGEVSAWDALPPCLGCCPSTSRRSSVASAQRRPWTSSHTPDPSALSCRSGHSFGCGLATSASRGKVYLRYDSYAGLCNQLNW